MDANNVSIATMTWARDPQEEGLLREALPRLAALNLPTFVTDGGSGTDFLGFLRGFPNFEVSEAGGRGLWAQVRRSLSAARDSGRKFILYTEPDKSQYFKEYLSEFIAESQGQDGVGVTLASRSAEGYATFPEFQRFTESVINRCCAEVTGRDFDYSYGPFLLDGALLPRLLEAPDDVGWGWRPYAFGLAHLLGYRVESVVKDFQCPPEQRDDDARERVYRMRQLAEGVRGLTLSTRAAG